MAAVPLANYHDMMRVLLGDGGCVEEGFDWLAEQLNAAMRMTLMTMECASLNPRNPAELEDALPNPDTEAYLVTKAAYLLVGGNTPEAFRTRAVSHRVDASARRDTLMFLETLLSELDARGNVCGASTDRGHKGLFATSADVVTCTQMRDLGFLNPNSCCE